MVLTSGKVNVTCIEKKEFKNDKGQVYPFTSVTILGDNGKTRDYTLHKEGVIPDGFKTGVCTLKCVIDNYGKFKIMEIIPC